LDRLLAGSEYIQGNFDSKESYLKLKEKLDNVDKQAGKKAVRIFYLSTSPEYFHVIAQSLEDAGLLLAEDQARTRVVVEKPFGHNLPSAKELNSMLLRCMAESQIYRIDHYLGKETVQNLLVFRFSNGIFEPIWNRKYISHVEISVCESIGVGSRAGYFDKSGILRDVVQNHAFQLMTLVAMEPPVDFSADAVRDEKVKVLRSVKRIPIDDVAYKVVRARYLSGKVGDESVVGYLGEKGVADNSETETFVALELAVDNWRWSGVPFFIRSGKRLKKRVTEISVHFRSTPQLFFRKENVGEFETNVLTFQIQPEEGIKVRVNAKPPGKK
jgi:glucose-6-phosphate 1-dehydrogenase